MWAAWHPSNLVLPNAILKCMELECCMDERFLEPTADIH